MAEFRPQFGALVKLSRDCGYRGASFLTPPSKDIFADFLASQKPRTNRFLSRTEAKHLPPTSWLIENLIPNDADVLLVAPSKFLKTFFAIYLACAIATGTKVFGSLDVLKLAAFLNAGEGGRAVSLLRVTAWEIANRLEPFSCSRLHVASSVPTINADLSDYLADAKSLLPPGERAGLFVIDTLNRAVNGADEDKSSTASAYLKMLAEIREAAGGSTLTIHHMGKNLEKGARGSSAFYAGFDTVIAIDRAEKDEATGTYFLTVRVDKQKDGEDGQTFHLRSRRIETPAGPSLVLEPATEDEARRATGKQVGLRRHEVGAALREFGACPGGANAWDGKKGGTTTRILAEIIARIRAQADGNRGVTEKEINVTVAALNKGARDGGPFDAYVVQSAKGGRQWAIFDGTSEEDAPHA